MQRYKMKILQKHLFFCQFKYFKFKYLHKSKYFLCLHYFLQNCHKKCISCDLLMFQTNFLPVPGDDPQLSSASLVIHSPDLPRLLHPQHSQVPGGTTWIHRDTGRREQDPADHQLQCHQSQVLSVWWDMSTHQDWCLMYTW